MQKENSFPLVLEYEGKRYKGMVMPSEEVAANGLPVYFRVSVCGTIFAYLCCGDNGWFERDKMNSSSGLISAIGKYISDFYH